MIQLLGLVVPLMTGLTVIEPNPIGVQYIQSMIGKRIDYDKVNWYQCVDWALKYIDQIYKKHITQIWTARNWRKTGKWFEWWTRKKPWQKTPPPKAGDVIFMDVAKHTKGHVWVVVSATSEYVRVSEQNWTNSRANGKWWDAITIHKRYYNVVLWWFTKENAN